MNYLAVCDYCCYVCDGQARPPQAVSLWTPPRAVIGGSARLRRRYRTNAGVALCAGVNWADSVNRTDWLDSELDWATDLIGFRTGLSDKLWTVRESGAIESVLSDWSESDWYPDESERNWTARKPNCDSNVGRSALCVFFGLLLFAWISIFI